jgi:hypothetical protein
MLLRISFHSLLICLRYGLDAEVKCWQMGLYGMGTSIRANG